jgi:capsular polysaccharide biosynthesis protein
VTTLEDFALPETPVRTSRTGRNLTLRSAEFLFHRWPMLLLPVLLGLGVGLLTVRKGTDEYQSSATVNVSSGTILQDLTAINQTNLVGFETSATKTSRAINELLQTDSFVRTIISGAGLDDAYNSQQITIAQVRSSVHASTTGDTLVQLTATSTNANAATNLVTSLLTGYSKYVLDSEVSDSNAAASFLEGKLSEYQQALDDSTAALNEYVQSHPAPTIGDRPTEETLAIQRLNETITQASTRLQDAQSNIDKAKLAAEQSKSEVGQKLKVVDSPKVPDSPQPRLKSEVITVAIFVLLGLMISLAITVVAALLDSSVRTVDDIGTVTDLTVVAAIPFVKEKDLGAHKKQNARGSLPADWLTR